jgi:hypothetical protein
MTPQQYLLSKLITDNDIDPSKLHVIAYYDKADLGLEQTKTWVWSKPMKATWTSFSMMTQRSGKILDLLSWLELVSQNHWEIWPSSFESYRKEKVTLILTLVLLLCRQLMHWILLTRPW